MSGKHENESTQQAEDVEKAAKSRAPKGRGARTGAPPRDSSARREHEQLDEQLDDELEDSFPASDPPSVTQEPPRETPKPRHRVDRSK